MALVDVKIDGATYQQQLSDLRGLVKDLEAKKGQLIDQRNKLDANFVSRALSGNMIEMIKKKEDQVQGAINTVQRQIDQIEQYLGEMSRSEDTIKGKIQDAASQSISAFQ